MGNTLSELKRYAEAYAAYDRAIALDPNYHQAWYNRGLVLKEIGAYGNAIESFNRAIALQEDPMYCHQRDGIWLHKKLF